jgi:beta-phosphoglucomutase-like phosphatase (HAD superfamily)
VINSEDIETSKPAPDLVTAAAKKLKLSPAECAMLGDTPFDAESAKHAGVVCLGVTCGGNDVERPHVGGRAARVIAIRPTSWHTSMKRYTSLRRVPRGSRRQPWNA